MAASQQTKALEAWLRSNGAYFHPSVRVMESPEGGVHMRAIDTIDPATTIATGPHSLALSYLNALVDDDYLVFREQRGLFKVEAIGFFYLMTQYINRERSFWNPYLDTLPTPESELIQPLFFEDADDVAWLEGTDVLHTVTARKKVYERYYAEGIAVLKAAGLDVELYTWHLFLWAVTTYTSRSFSSRSLRPHAGKCWTTYKIPPTGTRQAVLLDMSTTTAEDLHFPVLFPGLDAANHDHDAKVDWTFDVDRFSVTLAKPGESHGIGAGLEVFNNYGPKSNGELLIGYGFCIEDNPHDSVAMTLKAPPASLQNQLRRVSPGYFTQDGDWNSQKATFQLKKPSTISQTASGLAQRPQIFHQLPEPLLELLLYILREERNLSFEFQARPLAYLTDLDSPGRRYLPHIARMIVQSLAPKLTKLQTTTPEHPPSNKKQEQASIYRYSQVVILSALISVLKTYTRSLITAFPLQQKQPPRGPTLLTLPSFVTLLQDNSLLDPIFLAGIEANARTQDLGQLRAAGWEEDIWVLLFPWLLLRPENLPSWLKESFGEYIALDDGNALDSESVEKGQAEQQADDLLPLVQTAAAALPGSLWEDESWTAQCITQTGGAVMRWDSFLVMAPTGRSEGGEEPTLFVYFLFP